jgi:membrane-associated phospholipid phosphatase
MVHTELSSQAAWHLFTRLGESQILLPAAALLVLSLLRQPGGRVLAQRWLLGLCCAVALTTTTKLAFIGWGIGSAALDFTGISGHAMFAAAIHPLLFGALLPASRPQARRFAVAAGVLLAALVAVSRVVVDAHSVSESVAGFVLGSAVGLLALQLGTLRLRLGAMLLPLTAVWLMATPWFVPPSQTHSMVIQLALKLSGHDQPFTREGLHQPKRQT